VNSFKRYFRCAQVQHFLVFCWLVVALIRDPGQGTLKGLGTSLPAKLTYWTTLRMVRSGPWDAQGLMTAMAATTLRTLPPPLDGVRYLIGDRTLQAKRGQQHPLGHTARHREHDPYTCGCEMVRLMASWDRFRIPLALVPIDPQCRGHQNILFRQMLKAVVPPAWARRVVVVADARFAANETLRLMAAKQYASVVAMPRTRKFTHGKPLRDMVPHRPKRFSYRRARDKPDGRRKDDWVFARRATLHHLGDVTIVLSKTRRHDGPKGGKIIVTHLTEASAGEVLSIYARRWGVEVTIKELKSGLHLGQMHGPRRPNASRAPWRCPYGHLCSWSGCMGMMRR
jgi:Transposase DDE domain